MAISIAQPVGWFRCVAPARVLHRAADGGGRLVDRLAYARPMGSCSPRNQIDRTSWRRGGTAFLVLALMLLGERSARALSRRHASGSPSASDRQVGYGAVFAALSAGRLRCPARDGLGEPCRQAHHCGTLAPTTSAVVAISANAPPRRDVWRRTHRARMAGAGLRRNQPAARR
jgi:hypothetical protein